jgi:phage tail-like protein
VNAHHIAQLLPGAFQRALPRGGTAGSAPSSPLAAYLAVMDRLHEGPETQLAAIDAICDPHRTPDSFVPFLARWLDLDRLFTPERAGSPRGAEAPLSSGLGHLRQLTAVTAQLSKRRGTRGGLTALLEVATGVRGFEVTDADRPFHIRVVAPLAASVHRALVERIIEVERPAYCT